jgi:Protein of unknown function (DUF2786)
MNTDREKILHKIRSLLAKTEEAGATEFEAFSALEKARAMMDAYEVTAEDVELKGETAGIHKMGSRDPHDARAFLSIAIARFTETRCWIGRDGELNFCGMPADTQLAAWMLDSLGAFILRELVQHMIGQHFPRAGMKKRAINGFISGASGRINARLNELSAQSAAKRTSNGRALVSGKQSLVAQHMAGLGLNLRSKKTSRKTNWDSYTAGQGAGNRASFGKPVSGTGATFRLGHG